MVSKRYFLFIALQIMLILVTSVLISFLFFKSSYIILPLNFCFILILQSLFLIGYINNFNKKVTVHIESLVNNDLYNLKSLESTNKAFIKLNKSLQLLYEKLELAKIEKTVGNEYHKYSIEHINVGFISFNNENGKIKYINKAAKELLSIETPNNIEKLTEVSDKLVHVLQELNPGQSKLMKLLINNELLQLSIKITEIKLLDENIRLVSMQNIKNELEEHELETWQRLIRILTHEIMNSIAPIISATKSLYNFLTVGKYPLKSSEISDKVIKDSVTGLEAIRIRSDGLLDFVKKYRSLTHLPKPNFETFSVIDLFQHIETLMRDELARETVNLEILDLSKDGTLTADYNLVEQIIINLINNSVFALKEIENKSIQLVAKSGKNERPEILVIDNGIGIPKENLDKILDPFFTTRKSGSGIGLSLARQVMHLHNGNIKVHSIPNEETTFILSF